MKTIIRYAGPRWSDITFPFWVDAVEQFPAERLTGEQVTAQHDGFEWCLGCRWRLGCWWLDGVLSGEVVGGALHHLFEHGPRRGADVGAQLVRSRTENDLAAGRASVLSGLAHREKRMLLRLSSRQRTIQL